MAFSAVLAALGLTLAGVGAQLWSGHVPPNRWVGFRTPRTLSDRRVWYAANRIAGRDLAIAGSVTALSSLLLASGLPMDNSVFVLLMPLAPILFATVHSLWAVSVWMADHPPPERQPPEEDPQARSWRARRAAARPDRTAS